LARQGRRPLSLYILVALILLLAAVAVVVIFSERHLEGSILGRAPIHSLAVADNGFFVGTDDGLFVSEDGLAWSRHPKFPRGEPAVVGSGPFDPDAQARTVAFVVLRRLIYELEGSNATKARFGASAGATALGVSSNSLLVADSEGRIREITARGEGSGLASGGPRQVQAIDGSAQGQAYVVAGGIGSGLWRASGTLTTQSGVWVRLLETPVTAIVVDPENSNRILIGTPGGILVSGNRGDRWQFTQFRGPIAGLSDRGGEFFAVSDRLIYRSSDGEKDWAGLAAEERNVIPRQ
jgi:hypothetical protein